MADIELIQPLLGLSPYILIEPRIDPADGEPTFKIRAGGGLKDEDDILVILMSIIEAHTDVPIDPYLDLINARRALDGRPPLES